MKICGPPVVYNGGDLLTPGCYVYGDAGTRLAGALKACCPPATYTPENNGTGTNCIVTCGDIDEAKSDAWNPCMKEYYDNHGEDEKTWTCNNTDMPREFRNGAVQGRTGGWGGLVDRKSVV